MSVQFLHQVVCIGFVSAQTACHAESAEIHPREVNWKAVIPAEHISITELMVRDGSTGGSRGSVCARLI